MRKFKGSQFIAVPVCFFALLGCSVKKQDPVLTDNQVTSADSEVHKNIGEGQERYAVYGAKAFSQLLSQGSIASPKSVKGLALLQSSSETAPNTQPVATPAPTAATAPSSLTVGFPLDLIGHRYVFGAVVTKLSDKTNETLGRLKLTDLTPLHVTPRIFRVSEQDFVFALTGCVKDCEESSDEQVILTMPILGVDTQSQMVALDLATLGKALNLIQMLDPKGEYTKLVTESTQTVRADFSLSTLVFDIDVTMIPKENPEGAAKTTFTTRWFLRLTSSFDPAFAARAATPGVGFFMTERTTAPKIERQPRPKTIVGAGTTASAHYYIKNVPPEYRPAFNNAFDNWNKMGQALFGKPILSYEHVEATDPRYALLVAGDARFHILEWDLDNVAPYGGLGPSLANQFTGEIFSSNVLIQGPTIVKLYTAWFKANARATELQEQGLLVQAEQVLLDARRALEAERAEMVKAATVELSLGRGLTFRTPAQDPSLEDPLMEKLEFEIVPKGFTYEQYMAGYFQEMVAHELGHNLGLRHNFRGNLSSTATEKGKVSSSIMEYLGRGYRHLNAIGKYDEMAMRFGYLGTMPTVLTGFCTDEDVPTDKTTDLSVECSRDDATADPFSFFLERLERASVYLVLPGSAEAPVWTAKDMETELTAILTNLGLYAKNPAATSSRWTNFFGKPGRPRNATAVKNYVLRQVQNIICGDDLLLALGEKTTMAAKRKTLDNIQALWAKTSAVMTTLGAFTSAELACE